MPTLVPSAAASSAVPATTLWTGRSRSACIATSTLMMLAGRCLPCGSLAAMMSPLSRSATSHASAEMSLGTGGVPAAVMTPHPASASPPTGSAGTASGWGGSPAVGTSDASTAGGVLTWYGQAALSGEATGSAFASAGLTAKKSAAARAVARPPAIPKVAIVSED